MRFEAVKGDEIVALERGRLVALSIIFISKLRRVDIPYNCVADRDNKSNNV
jgi:hypothetical protein